MEELEQVIKNFLLNKKLTDIEFYNINPNYFSPDPEKTWVINGGVELAFEDEKFSFAWSEEKHFFDINPDEIGALVGELPHEALEAKNVDGLNKLVGNEIRDLTFKWNFYYEYDEDFNLQEDEKYMPVEIMMTFSNGDQLQLAAIKYSIYNNDIVDLYYDSQVQLLVAFNKIYEIQTEPEEEDTDPI